MNVLLSLDPSSTCTGWAVFEYDNKDCKLLLSGQCDLTKGNHVLEDRIEALHDLICGLCFEWAPNVAVYEKPDLFTNPKFRSAKTQKAYRAAIDATKGALWQRIGMDKSYGVTVQDWKSSKSKKCTILEVNSDYKLKLTVKENDQADAIGIGDAWLQRIGTENAYPADKKV